MSDDLFVLEGRLPVLAAPVGLASYDYDFRAHFQCRSLLVAPDGPVIARVGAIDDYAPRYHALLADGIRLIHDPDEHDRCSLASGWAPLLAELTPETWVADELPPVAEVEARFGWPVFVKGDRQTSRHRGELSIARSPEHYERIRAAWGGDRILRWQRAAVRRFVPLRYVGERPEGIQASHEFRVFCWRGCVVGVGAYWTSHAYAATAPELAAITRLAEEAARRVAVPFLVVDVAQAATGEWLVIECNDAQEASYAGVVPLALWAAILGAEGG
ncbi:MAG: ATP-grasp domain-containing protein [Myxococcota bacterium]